MVHCERHQGLKIKTSGLKKSYKSLKTAAVLRPSLTNFFAVVVDVNNGVPSIILLLSMIEKGNVTRTDKFQYFVEHFGTASSKTKVILQNNLIARYKDADL